MSIEENIKILESKGFSRKKDESFIIFQKDVRICGFMDMVITISIYLDMDGCNRCDLCIRHADSSDYDIHLVCDADWIPERDRLVTPADENVESLIFKTNSRIIRELQKIMNNVAGQLDEIVKKENGR